MKYAFLLVFVAVSVILPLVTCSASAAMITDKKLQGAYVGLNPILVSQGASYEESIVRFSMDDSGIVLEQRITADGSAFSFRIGFTRDWITIPVKGWGVDDGIAIRQELTTPLAQLIFLFPPRVKDGFDAVMILGEGVPAPLGVFVREGMGDARLRKFYADEFRPRMSDARESWLKPINVARAEEVMRSGMVREKTQLLKDAEHNLWTGTEQEIASRLDLIARGINDHNPKVQQTALEAFTLGGRVIGGVRLVTDALSRYDTLKPEVLESAMDAATVLLYETYNHNKVLGEVRDVFKTVDVSAVHVLTGGLVTPHQFKALERIVRRPASRSWTAGQETALRNAIMTVVADKEHTSERARQIGVRALADYPLPGGSASVGDKPAGHQAP